MFYGLIDRYTQSILIFTGINIIAAYSFFAPFKTGQVSLGQAGFMAVGAYASAIAHPEIRPALRRCAAVRRRCIAGVIGVVVGFPALRIKGIYLLLLTLGFSEIIQVIVLSWDYVGGAQGFRNIPFNPLTLEWVVGIIVLLIFFFGRSSAPARPRDGLDPSGRDCRRSHGHRRRAHQAVWPSASAPDRRRSPARFMRTTRPTWTRPPSTSCCRSKS